MEFFKVNGDHKTIQFYPQDAEITREGDKIVLRGEDGPNLHVGPGGVIEATSTADGKRWSFRNYDFLDAWLKDNTTDVYDFVDWDLEDDRK